MVYKDSILWIIELNHPPSQDSFRFQFAGSYSREFELIQMATVSKGSKMVIGAFTLDEQSFLSLTKFTVHVIDRVFV